MSDNDTARHLWMASSIAAAFSIACILLYLIAVPVGLYMLYRIPTQCPPKEVNK